MKFIDLDYLNKNFNLEAIKEYPNELLLKLPNPKLSVILITYNHLEYIRNSIEGILNQKVNFDYELIIGDDESNDGTREICIEYAKKYPERIRLILHSRKNVVKILGKPCGIFQIIYNHLLSRGKYVAICSGDDEWADENKLQTQLDCIQSSNETSIVFSSWRETYLNEDGSTVMGRIYSNVSETATSKASTAFYLNIKNLMPIEMLNVIQEDSWTRFILKGLGNAKNCPDLNPVLVNTPPTSIMRSIDNIQRALHAVNYGLNLCIAYRSTKYKEDAFLTFKQTINALLLNSRYQNLRCKLLYVSIKHVGVLRFISYYLIGLKFSFGYKRNSRH